MAELRGAAAERNQLADRVREYERRDIANELSVPVSEVIGSTADEMRAAGQSYKAKVDAAVSERLQAMGVNPAAPISEVTSDGRPPAPSGSSFVDAFRPRNTQE